MQKLLPIGVSDFKQIGDENYYYVDKSLLIREIIDNPAKALLLFRPRRFGKTLNLSMLKYYFEKGSEDYSYLFDQLKISTSEDRYLAEQGRYPVIFLTFKDIKEASWENAYHKVKRLLADEFLRHNYLIKDGSLEPVELDYFNQIITLEATSDMYADSLHSLSKFLEKYHGEKVIILIDEYDAPIESGFMRDYYDQVIDFMRNMLSGGLNDNKHLKKCVLTGILRVAKESIFSGLNNLSVDSLLNERFDQYFGLLEDEVQTLLDYYGLSNSMDEVREWYNGYQFGTQKVYNPWSVVQYIENQGVTGLYWVNTSGNDLIRKMIATNIEVKEELELLLNNQHIKKEIVENIVYGEVEETSDSIWSFFLFCGYLTVDKEERKRGRSYCELKIPNQEVYYLYEDVITRWFKSSIKAKEIQQLLTSLTTGDIEIFSQIFEKFVLNSLSFFDTGAEETEKIYHAFVLGLMVYLSQEYEVRSNRESGYGRYDLMLLPRDKSKLGIVMEFKKAEGGTEDALEDAAEKALNQIDDRRYWEELRDRGCSQILELGFAFSGKKVRIRERRVDVKS